MQNEEQKISNGLRFKPSRVKGAEAVDEVAFFPDRFELYSGENVFVHPFIDIAIWPTPKLFWQMLTKFGIRPRELIVGERDWFHEPADMFFRFYTQPPITIYMPVDKVKEGYSESHFARIGRLIRDGGFQTHDLG